jgi:hypothetical protein
MLNALLDRIFGVATLTADAASGRSRATLLGGEPKPVSWLALPGFASGGSSGDRAWSIRLGSVVIAFAAVGRPEGEQAGDRTIWTGDGLTLRLRSKALTVLDSAGTPVVSVDTEAGTVTLAQGTKYVVLAGDNVVPDVAFFAHTHSGVTTGPGTSGPATPGVPTIGTCSTTATKTKAN